MIINSILFNQSNLIFNLSNLRDNLYLKCFYIDYDKSFKTEKELNNTDIEFYETMFKISKLETIIDKELKDLKENFIIYNQELKINKDEKSSDLNDHN